MSTVIGKLIKKRREELGLTQEELAIKLGYKSKSTINKIELGVNDITQNKIVAFADALDVPVKYLMGWDADVELDEILKDGQIPRLYEIIEKSNNRDYLLRFISLYVRLLRIKNDMTEKSVSQKIGVTLEEYLAIEDARPEINFKVIEKILPENSQSNSYLKGFLAGLDYTLKIIDEQNLTDVEADKRKLDMIKKAICQFDKDDFTQQ